MGYTRSNTLSDIHFPGPEGDVPSASHAAGMASALLRYAALVALAIFLILVMLPVALAAAGRAAGVPF